MKLQLNLIAKILITILIFSVYKFYYLYQEGAASIDQLNSDLLVAKSEKSKVEEINNYVKTFNHEGGGHDIKIFAPSIFNQLIHEFPFYNVNAQITTEISNNSLILNDINLTMGKVKYVKMTMKGTFKNYAGLKEFVDHLKSFQVLIKKISVTDKINFEIVFYIVGKY